MRFDPTQTANAIIAADGSRIVFGALVAVGGHKHWHVVARNVRTNGLSLVDIAPTGRLENGDSAVVGLSADGLHVLFRPPVKSPTDVRTYERNLVTHRSVLVSVPQPGETWTSANAEGISRDGRYVVLQVDVGGKGQVYLRDVADGTTQLVSHAPDGSPGNDSSYGGADVSPDGSKVVFMSYASNLVGNDTNKQPDIFLWTRADDRVVRISVAADGSQLDKGSRSPRFTTDGQHVAFSSDAALTGDACDTLSDGVNDSGDGRNAYVLDLRSGAVAHPHQDCSQVRIDYIDVGSDGGATLAVDESAGEWGWLVIRHGGTERSLKYVSAPTSITSDGRYVGINHYDPTDTAPGDKTAGALVWDLTKRQPTPAWLARTLPPA